MAKIWHIGTDMGIGLTLAIAALEIDAHAPQSWHCALEIDAHAPQSYQSYTIFTARLKAARGR
jgi:hypothetical protein